MKTIKTLLALCTLYATQANAQIFGEQFYSHPQNGNKYYLSSAKSAAQSAGGFVIVGYMPFSPATNPAPDFVIDKVNNLLGISASDFSKSYKIIDNASCGAPAAVLNCSGVSIQTVSLGGGERYVITGAYNRGVFAAMLDGFGNVMYSYRWNFPGTAGSVNKPMIREALTPGRYFICGEYNSQTYVIKFGAGGGSITPAWANWYNNGMNLTARDIIPSPYNANEVIVVGRTDVPGSPTAADAFFMSLNDAAAGAVNYATNYNKQYDGDDWISCIEYANDPAFQGYLIGGRSQYPAFPGGPPGNLNFTQWMAKLDPNGNILWSSLIFPNANTPTTLSGSEINDVKERFDPNSGRYENYGAAGSYVSPFGPNQDNLVVFKLDAAGGVSLSPDEFHYMNAYGPGLNGPSFTYPQLTQINSNPTGLNDGFQVYGDNYSSDLYIAKAYFNGTTGCEIALNMFKDYPGPTVVGNFNVNVTAMTIACPTLFNLGVNNLSTPLTPICPLTTSVTGGSNARINNATGIASNSQIDSRLELFPNPVNSKATISYSANGSDQAKIEVYNMLGQKINVTVINNESGKAQIDFTGIGVTNGIYFADVTIDGTTSRVKFVYSDK